MTGNAEADTTARFGARLGAAVRVVGMALLVLALGCGIELPSNIYKCDNGNCPSPLTCAPEGSDQAGYCIDKGSETWPDAGLRGDVSPSERGDDAGAVSPDGGSSAASTDAATSAGASSPEASISAMTDGQTGVPPHVEPDAMVSPTREAGSATVMPEDSAAPDAPEAGPAVVADAGTPPTVVADAGTPPENPPTTQPTSCVAWANATVLGEVPAGAKLLAVEYNEQATPLAVPQEQAPPKPWRHEQYLCCRDGFTPGKWVPHYGCNSMVLINNEWKATFVSATETFSVLVPPPGCAVEFVARAANGALPARALVIGLDPGQRPVYACSAHVERDDRKGDHIGRVDQSVSPPVCRFEWYEELRAQTDFKVLAQISP